MLFWRYSKDIQTFYFGYFEHAWLHPPKMTVSTCRRLRCLSACQKLTYSLTSLLRYYILKNPAIWLADSILAHNWRTRIFARYGIGGEIPTKILVSILDHFYEKLMAKFFKKSKNPISASFLAHFVQIWAKMNFPQKRGSARF